MTWRTASATSIWRTVLVAFAVLVLLSAGATWLASSHVGDAVGDVEATAIPAQSAAAQLTSAYVEQGTGELGYVLTGGAAFLKLYTSGRDRAGQLQSDLRVLLHTDRQGTQWLDRVAASGSAWQKGAAGQNAIRQRGPVDSNEIIALALTGEQRFGAVLNQLVGLAQYTRDLTQRQMSRISAARTSAAIVTGTAVTIVLCMIVISVLVMRRTVGQPMTRLLTQVRGTADGTYDAPIDAHGPKELATIGAAVERMRRTILDNSEQLVVTERELALRDERDRLAADLHDLTVQRVYGIGLNLRNLADQRPELAPDLNDVIDDAEETIQELRTVIYGISRFTETATVTDEIRKLVQDSARFLGFEPSLHLDGPIDLTCTPQTTAELTATLREALSNVARHARASGAKVQVAVADGQLHLTVADDGRGIPEPSAPGNGIANMRYRAERLGGSATITTPRAGGTRLHWQVPIDGPTPATSPTPTDATTPADPSPFGGGAGAADQ